MGRVPGITDGLSGELSFKPSKDAGNVYEYRGGGIVTGRQGGGGLLIIVTNSNAIYSLLTLSRTNENE